MSITTNWNIVNLERNTADGKVTTVHYAEQAAPTRATGVPW